MKKVEYWLWRYEDPRTGRYCRTTFPYSVAEAAARYPGAEPIPGTMTVREVFDDERDTLPGIVRHLRV